MMCVCVCVCVCVQDISNMQLLMDLNQILWEDRFAAKAQSIRFCDNPYSGLDPRWIFRFFNMDRDRAFLDIKYDYSERCG